MTSRNQGLSPNDKGRQRRESLGTRLHERVHTQNVRDFPQTKLDNGINSPFLLNEHGDPRFFFQVFAKNRLMKNIF